MSIVTRSDLLIHVETGEYPVSLEEARQKLTNVSFGVEIEEEDLLGLGYAKVYAGDIPEGDVVKEVTPVQVDGQWVKQYEARPFTEAEKNDIRNQFLSDFSDKLNEQLAAELAVGLPFQHQGETYHIQLRDKDQINLLALARKASNTAQAKGAATLMTIRPYENVSLEMTAEDVLNLTDHALVEMEEVYKRVWALKDEAENAETKEDLPALPASFLVAAE